MNKLFRFLSRSSISIILMAGLFAPLSTAHAARGCGFDAADKPLAGESCMGQFACDDAKGTKSSDQDKNNSCTPQVCCKTAAPAAAGAAGAAAGAASGTPGSDIKLTNPLGAGTTLLTVINRVISTFLGIVGALALIVFIYGGVVYMTAGGSDRVGEARDTIKYGAIGLAIIMFAYVITNSFLYVLAG